MRRISFGLTKAQLKDGSKDVTRRLGWKTLEAGTQLRAVSKCMGLKKGEKADVYGVIEVTSVRRERLDLITQEDVDREGFPEFTVAEFVEFFCNAMRCTPDTEVTRIEFKRIRDLRWPVMSTHHGDLVDGDAMRVQGKVPVLVISIDGGVVARLQYGPESLDRQPLSGLAELAIDDARELLTARWEAANDR